MLRLSKKYLFKGLIFVFFYQILVEVNDSLIILNSANDSFVRLYFLPPGLSLSFLILMGPHYFPFLLINPIYNTIINERPWFLKTFVPLILTSVYGGSVYVLKYKLNYEPKKLTSRNMTKFISIAIIAPILVAILVNLLLKYFNGFTWQVFWSRVPDWFIGDLLGIFTIYPIVLSVVLYFEKYNTFSLSNIRVAQLFSFVLVNMVTIGVFFILIQFDINLLFGLTIPIMLIALQQSPKYIIFVGSFIPFEFSILLSITKDELNIIELQLFIFFVILTTLYLAALKSENIQIEQKLSNQKLKQLEQAKYTTIGKLSQGISHDLNNVLHSAYLYLDSLEAENRKFSNGDITTLRSILNVNENLLERLKVIGAFSTVKKESINVSDCIYRLKSTLENLIKKEVELIYEIDDSASYILGNLAQLEQIILNLVVNANDSILDSGSITIALSCNSKGTKLKKYLSLSVIDTGIGMNEETQSQLFEMLYTTKNTNSGLGL